MRWTYLRLRLKDYDALVGLTFGTSDLQCASEYERSTKSTARYVDIRRQLAQKTMVHAVIYIVERGRANSLDRRPVKLAQFQSSLCYLQRISSLWAKRVCDAHACFRRCIAEFLTQMAAMPIQGRTDLLVS